MKNLNKEEFWNPLYEKYPEAVQLFCDWIDEYKKAVNWNEIIGEKVKFHDLPYEMQFGLMGLFGVEISSRFGSNTVYSVFSCYTYPRLEHDMKLYRQGFRLLQDLIPPTRKEGR